MNVQNDAEINKKTDLKIELATLERAKHRRVTGLNFAIRRRRYRRPTELVKLRFSRGGVLYSAHRAVCRRVHSIWHRVSQMFQK